MSLEKVLEIPPQAPSEWPELLGLEASLRQSDDIFRIAYHPLFHALRLIRSIISRRAEFLKEASTQDSIIRL